MTCNNCNGIGLVDKTQEGVVYAQEVCSTCNGVGNDGTEAEETPVKVTKKHK